MKDWLKRLDEELQILKKMSGIMDNLSRAEMIDCIKDKLDYALVKKMDTAFAAKEVPLTCTLAVWTKQSEENPRNVCGQVLPYLARSVARLSAAGRCCEECQICRPSEKSSILLLSG